MKELLEKIEEMNKINEELETTRAITLAKSKTIVIKKLNTLYKILKYYSDIAKMIPEYAASYYIPLSIDSYLKYYRNGNDWGIKSGNHYLPLDIDEISDNDYRFFTISNEIIQKINEEEIIKTVEEKTIKMFEDYIDRTRKQINEYNKAFESFNTNISTKTITSLLDTLFKANNDFKKTGDLELIEIISGYITTLEEILKGVE